VIFFVSFVCFACLLIGISKRNTGSTAVARVFFLAQTEKCGFPQQEGLDPPMDKICTDENDNLATIRCVYWPSIDSKLIP